MTKPFTIKTNIKGSDIVELITFHYNHPHIKDKHLTLEETVDTLNTLYQKIEELTDTINQIRNICEDTQ